MTTSVYAQCFKHSGLQHLNLVYHLNLWLSQMFIMSQFKDTLFHFQGLGNIWVFIEYCQYIIVNAPLQFCIFFLQPMIKQWPKNVVRFWSIEKTLQFVFVFFSLLWIWFSCGFYKYILNSLIPPLLNHFYGEIIWNNQICEIQAIVTIEGFTASEKYPFT